MPERPTNTVGGGRTGTTLRYFARAACGFVFPVAWMYWIFTASTGAVACSQTSPVFESVFRLLIPGVSGAAVDQCHFFFRKGAHLAEYALLAVLLWRAFEWAPFCRMAASKRASLVLLVSVAYAASDEFHQSFIASRSSSGWDVLLDTAGVLVGLGIIFAVKRAPGRDPLAVAGSPAELR